MTSLLLVSSTALASPRADEVITAHLELSPRRIALEVPPLVLDLQLTSRNGHHLLHHPVMRAIFKGVQLPCFAPDQRALMLAVRPRGTGLLLRFRIRFDAGVEGRPINGLRRFLQTRPTET